MTQLWEKANWPSFSWSNSALFDLLVKARFEQGRLLATLIPGARLVALESDNHPILPDEPAWPMWVNAIEAFLSD